MDFFYSITFTLNSNTKVGVILMNWPTKLRALVYVEGFVQPFLLLERLMTDHQILKCHIIQQF